MRRGLTSDQRQQIENTRAGRAEFDAIPLGSSTAPGAHRIPRPPASSNSNNTLRHTTNTAVADDTVNATPYRFENEALNFQSAPVSQLQRVGAGNNHNNNNNTARTGSSSRRVNNNNTAVLLPPQPQTARVASIANNNNNSNTGSGSFTARLQQQQHHHQDANTVSGTAAAVERRRRYLADQIQSLNNTNNNNNQSGQLVQGGNQQQQGSSASARGSGYNFEMPDQGSSNEALALSFLNDTHVAQDRDEVLLLGIQHATHRKPPSVRAREMLQLTAPPVAPNDESEIKTLKNVEDVVSFFSTLMADPSTSSAVKFVTCNRAPRTLEFRPYDLTVVPRGKEAPEHFVVSPTAVVCVQPRQAAEVISLSDWMRESALFSVLRHIRFFRDYLVVKAFQQWRRNIRLRMYMRTRSALCKRFFLSKATFAQPTMQFVAEANNLASSPLVFVTQDDKAGKHDYTVEEFNSVQLRTRDRAKKVIEETMDRMMNNLTQLADQVQQRANVPDLSTTESLEQFLLANAIANNKEKRLGTKKMKSMLEARQEQMERMRDLKRSMAEYTLLDSYIRLIDYVAAEAVFRNVLWSVLTFNRTIQEQKVDQKRIGFQVLIHPMDSAMTFRPPEGEILKAYTDMIDEVILAANQTRRLIGERALKIFFSRSPRFWRLDTESKRDARINWAKHTMCNKIVKTDFTQAQQRMSQFDHSLKWVHFIHKEWPEIRAVWKEKKIVSSSDIASLYETITQANDSFRLLMSVHQGILFLNASKLKQDLTPRLEEITREVDEVLIYSAKTRTQQLQQYFRSKISALNVTEKTVMNLERFTNFVSALNEVQAQQQKTMDEETECESLFGLISDRNVAADDDEIKSLRDRTLATGTANNLYALQQQASLAGTGGGGIDLSGTMMSGTIGGLPQQQQQQAATIQSFKEMFQDTVFRAEAYRSVRKIPMLEQLRTDIENVNARSAEMYARLNSPDDPVTQLPERIITRHNSVAPHPYEAIGNLKVDAEDIDDFQKARERLTRWHKLLDDRDPNFRELDQLQRIFDVRKEIWSVLTEFEEQTYLWWNTPLSRIERDQVKNMVNDLHKRIHRVASLSHDEGYLDNICGEMERKIKFLKQKQLPIILSCANEHMKESHWKKILDELTMVPYSEDIALVQIDTDENAHFWDMRQVIQDQEDMAAGEANLRRDLDQIQKVWSTTEFETKKYKERQNMFILDNVEAILELLDEHQMSLQAKLANRHVDTVRPTVEMWIDRLRIVRDVIEEWITMQKSWMYLEFIFVAPDIKLQLKEESERFEHVDHFFCNLMNKAQTIKNVLDICMEDGQRNMMKANNNAIDSIQKRLEEYLETKRASFPRFYFLSNDELLAILSDVRNPRSVQPHLAKCFDAIASLNFTSETSNDIAGMLSPEGEEVPFERVIQAAGAVDLWLGVVERTMRSSLHGIMRDTYEAYPKQRREQWFFDFPAQCVQTVDMIYWTSEVENAIAEAKLKFYHVQYEQQLLRTVDLTRGQLSKLQRTLISTIIVLCVHNRDIVAKLVDNKVRDAADFEWVQQLRFHWESDAAMASNNVGIHHASAHLWYGYEYIGNQPRLVITPLTDRAFLTCTSALNYNLGAAPQGPAGTGKTESVKDLGKALARQVVVFNCFTGDTPITLEDGTSIPLQEFGEMFNNEEEQNEILPHVLSAFTQQDQQMGISAAPCVRFIRQPRKRNVVELTFADGRSIKCTPEHRFLMADGSWVEAQHLPLREEKSVHSAPSASNCVRMGVSGTPRMPVSKMSPADLAWTLEFSSASSYAPLKMNSYAKRERTFRFARIAGFVFAQQQHQQEISFTSERDCNDFVRDVELLGGKCTRNNNNVVSLQQSALLDAIVSLPRMTNSWPQFTCFCPIVVLREFLAGVFGGDMNVESPTLANETSSFFTPIKITQTVSSQFKQSATQQMSALCSLLDRAGCPGFIVNNSSAESKICDISIEARSSLLNTSMFMDKIGVRYSQVKLHRFSVAASFSRYVQKKTEEEVSSRRCSTPAPRRTREEETVCVEDSEILRLPSNNCLDARQFCIQTGCLSFFTNKNENKQNHFDMCLELLDRTELAEKETVYDITVDNNMQDGGNFLVNGLVAHNCSDGLTYQTMSRFFAGLAQAGAWACFDEFNRIEPEVLSVIAQQMLDITTNLAQRTEVMEFDGRKIKLNKNFGVFITMNPGYAGRSELPDNLKALFRPICMMIPDYALIAEIMFYSEGFSNARTLAQKMVQLYKLSSEQLSKQDHYDFGMRAVKSILVMAGGLKRANPSEDEDMLLIRAMRDSNVPKFLRDDTVLFMALIRDLFPNVQFSDKSNDTLQHYILETMERQQLQPVNGFIQKSLQLYDTLVVRHGLMLVGQTMCAKSTIIDVVKNALTSASEDNPDLAEEQHPLYNRVVTHVLNPKSITIGELYGDLNVLTREWIDGILSHITRQLKEQSAMNSHRQWIIFDGPVDAIWVENMNTVLDDSKMLCLFNGERIKLPSTATFMFEVQDLKVASPATVSRCGMVYLEPYYLDNDGWSPIAKSHCEQKQAANANFNAPRALQLFDKFAPQLLTWIREAGHEYIPTSDAQLVVSCIKLLNGFFEVDAPWDSKENLYQSNNTNKKEDDSSNKNDKDDQDENKQQQQKNSPTVNSSESPMSTSSRPSTTSFLSKAEAGQLFDMRFLLAVIWSFGANLSESTRPKFDQLLRSLIEQHLPQLVSLLPEGFSLFDICVHAPTRTFAPFADVVPEYTYNKGVPYFDIFIPTVESTALKYLLRVLTETKCSTLVTGVTGTGKSAIVADFIASDLDSSSANKDDSGIDSFGTTLSAQTRSIDVQERIESKLFRLKHNLLGPAPRKKCALFVVDDCNMPALEKYGASPPIELIRQVMGQGGFYERKKHPSYFKEVRDLVVLALAGNPGGGRNEMTKRFTSHFNVICQQSVPPSSQRKIFGTILNGFFDEWQKPEITRLAPLLVEAIKQCYDRISNEKLPTPSKSHYTFNLRDFSKVVQGILQVAPGSCPDEEDIIRVFIHEVSRVFHDRLVDQTDRRWWWKTLASVTQNVFLKPWSEGYETLIFGDYLRRVFVDGQEKKIYEAVSSMTALQKRLSDALVTYNVDTNQETDLVFFEDAAHHVSRISRIFRQPRGNCLLVGVSGSGRTSLAKLAANMNNMPVFTIQISRNFSITNFRENVKPCLFKAGIENAPCVFLLSDTQIVKEQFLEDVNNLLNAGEVPGMFEQEDYDAIIEGMRPVMKNANRPETVPSMIAYFVQRVRDNLHIVLTMSPVGDSFRNRLRMFPSLVNCCTIDWFDKWPEAALRGVAERQLQRAEGVPQQYLNDVVSMCVKIHQDVEKESDRFYEELRRHNYTTPTSYLELISSYTRMIEEQEQSIDSQINRLQTGLEKISSTQTLVDEMQADLVKKQPDLEQAAQDTERFMVEVDEEQRQAEAMRVLCSRDEAAAASVQREADQIRLQCQKEVDIAMPALYDAENALNALNSRDISEIRKLPAPPDRVRIVVEAVLVLLDVKDLSWNNCKVVMGKASFLNDLKDYKRDDLTERTIRTLQKGYTKNPNVDFSPDNIGRGSQAGRSLCLWVTAIENYFLVSRNIAPLKIDLAAAQTKLDGANGQLKAARDKLAEGEAKVAKLTKAMQETIAKKQNLEADIELTKLRLERAEKLISGLSGEEVRWKDTVANLIEKKRTLVGTMILAAGCVAYLGPFTAPYRQRMLSGWAKECSSLEIPVSSAGDGKEFTLADITDPVKIRTWTLKGLPADDFSVDNGVIVSRSSRWCLCLDPQGQANSWLRAMERENNLRILKQTDKDFLKAIEFCIGSGIPVLLENVGESIDATLDSVLLRQTFRHQGRLLIRLGDTDVDYDPSFRLYMTTKHPNPHLLPELQIKVTTVNFSVTQRGLEEQLLADVVRFERADLEQRADSTIVEIADSKRQLKDIEERILSLLGSSQGNILDNEALIQTLQDAKSTSTAIHEKLEIAEATQADIRIARERYRPVATRGSIIFTVTGEIAQIDHMYQISLDFFKKLFIATLKKTPPEDEVDARVLALLPAVTLASYQTICRGLFENHKQIFAFLIVSHVFRSNAHISPYEWNFFLRGSNGHTIVDDGTDVEELAPDSNKRWPSWAKPDTWNELLCLAEVCFPLNGLPAEILEHPDEWQEWLQHDDAYKHWPQYEGCSINPNTDRNRHGLSADYWNRYQKPLTEEEEREKQEQEEQLEEEQTKHRRESSAAAAAVLPPPPDVSEFLRMLIIRIFRPDLLFYSLTSCVGVYLGESFTESPPFDLDGCFEDSFPTAPIILVMTPGAEPWPIFRDFSEKKGFDKRRSALSLGQDQGKKAAELINDGVRDGKWVLLQNCHVYESWMGDLERILEDLLVKDVHPDFRLWLTTMPTKAFPPLVLQFGVKITQEPPRGLKANLRQTFQSQVDETLWNSVSRNGPQWRRLLFSLAFFHAVIQERKKFGSLGWNIPYGWNQPDFATAIKSLSTYVSSYSQIPWKALKFMVGVIDYGGRVTDFLDTRCQTTLLDRFFDPTAAEPGKIYQFTDDGVYHIPDNVEDLGAVNEYLAELPPYENPELFGLHSNADITFNRNTSRYAMDVVLSVQPRQQSGGGSSGGGSSGLAADDIVFGLANEFLHRLPESIDRKARAHEDTYKIMPDGTMNSLGTVVTQEIDVFNAINERVKKTVKNLQLAIGGQVVMSAQLEAIYRSFLLGRVPDEWLSNGFYLSRKPLGSWLDDTINRIEFLRDWNDNGPPSSYWLSGFFFPQGFLTGVLQMHSRQHNLSIDSISFRAHVTNHLTPDSIPPGELCESGVYVHGLHMEGARWSRERNSIDESMPNELFTSMPVIWLQPVVNGMASGNNNNNGSSTMEESNMNNNNNLDHNPSSSIAPAPSQHQYACPVYKTTARSGVLSTTGLSTNFVISLDLNSGVNSEPSHWILRGVAMLCMLDD